MNTKVKQNLFFIFIFGIAMGLLEAIVVVYIRTIYYPDGFHFPLVVVSQKILSAELLREMCTIVMLFSISFIVGQNKIERLSYFLYSFAIWDIFYYVGLKLFLNWPPSLLTWDILFLIPVIWSGPVLAPIICSLTMIVLSLAFLYLQNRQLDFGLRFIEWILIILGVLLIFITFIWDYSKILITNNLFSEIFSLSENDQFRYIISTYIPTYFNWPIFTIGIALIYISLIFTLKRSLISKEELI
jgi:hypothetical protein